MKSLGLFGGTNVDRNPGTQLGRNTIADAQRATRRTGQIPTFQGSLVPGFSPFQTQAFDIAGSAGLDPTLQAAQGFLPQLASGGFVGRGLGAGTLREAAGGGFSNLALPAAQSSLDFSRAISGIPAGLASTAAGENLASPFLSGEFSRIADPLISSFRDIQFPGLQGAIGARGLTGTRRQDFLEEDLQDRANRALSGVAADLIGRERLLQQEAQQSIPGILQQQLGGQLGAIGQLGGLSAGDIATQLGAAGSLDALTARDRALAGEIGLAAPGFAEAGLGAQINPLLSLGGLQQRQRAAELQDQLRRFEGPARAREDAIQREVQRAALIGGANPGFQGGPAQDSTAQNFGGLLGSLGGLGIGTLLGGPLGGLIGGQLGSVGGRGLGGLF